MSGNAPIQSYPEGASVRVSATLQNFLGVDIPPTDVRLLVMQPLSTVSVIHPTTIDGNACVGIIALSVPGVWRYRFETTVEPAAAVEGTFSVGKRTVPPPP